jgi:transcriptional regulator of acetoin/glycerol metabolism
MNLKVSDSELIDALEQTGGMIPIAAAKLGVTYQTIAARIKSQPVLVERRFQNCLS